jgi:hypothetical protein
MLFLPDQSLQLISGDTTLTVLNGISLELTPNQIFGWLNK